MLAWTTTPWSLPGNAAIAVHPTEQYVYVNYSTDEGQQDAIILAKNRLEVLDEKEYTISKEVSGQDLVGKTYQPLFKVKDLEKEPNHKKLYKVWAASFVDTKEGTGILHVAPAFGEDDLNLSEEHNLPVLKTIDSSGHVKADVGLDKIANKLEAKLFETPVGFKYISELMISENIVAGGEEAGGMGFQDYIPERDGSLAGLLLLEMMIY